VNIKVRQPLGKIMVPVTNNSLREKFEAVSTLILSEVNVKEVEYIKDTSDILVKKIKPSFKTLGPKYGRLMKDIAAAISRLSQKDIAAFEAAGEYKIHAADEDITLSIDDVEITSEDIPGWLVATDGKITVALDINITGELREEGIAREFINRIQNMRKDSGFDVTDKINIFIKKHDAVNSSINNYNNYISAQTLARSIMLVDNIDVKNAKLIDLEDDISTYVSISKI
jgi:isoleucyl-tRNA synthetase